MFKSVAARIPVSDLDRAREWYSEMLGLDPFEERDGGLLYRLGNTEFGLFTSTGESSGAHTQMGFEVGDIEAVVADLRERGLEFEEYDLGLEVNDGIMEIPGNYPSKGSGERAVWFKDLDGNLLGIGQPVR
jgi:catechol 2,3-dioxygenase-like lactoylglutathione lyase family enzyme